MRREKAIDLEQQLIELFDREDVLAFFDFQLPVDQKATVQGLCKISEPNQKDSKSGYLSILLIIDTVDEAVEDAVRALMKGISWAELKKHTPGIEMIIPMPHVSHGTQHYLEEIAVYLAPQQRITKSYLTDDLYPAIMNTLGCSGNGLIFWDERLRPQKDANRDRQDKPDRSLLERMIAYFTAR
ncbi:MAG: hypothetical protein ACYC7J_19485 [Syntrophales bacterium]